MRKRPQRRYKTKKQILDEIEKTNEKIKQLTHWADYSEVVDYDGALKARRKAFCLAENKLAKLKEKLAEFLTPQLPALDNGDPSITR